MKYGEWVPFHSSLCEGDKRGLSRATRFVYLELCLKARRYDGSIPLPRGFRSEADAVHDLIGGDRREVRAALEELTTVSVNEIGENEQMVSLTRSSVGTFLTISAHGRVAGRDKSTSRVRKFRERQTEECRIDSDEGNAFHAVSETQMKHVSETLYRREQNRTEQTPQSPSPPAVGPEQPELIPDMCAGNAKNDNPGQAPIPGLSDEVDDLHAHWADAMRSYNPKARPSKKIHEKHRPKARQALHSGRSLDDLKLAVDGLFLSDHHLKNPAWLALEYALRPNNIDAFIAAALKKRDDDASIFRMPNRNDWIPETEEEARNLMLYGRKKVADG